MATVRVLYLTMNPNRASTTVPTEGWFRCLRSRGLEPVLVSHQLGAFHAWAQEQGIPAYHVPLPFPSKLRPWHFLHALVQLWRIVRRHRIQIVHCNEQNMYPIGQYLARWCRLPVVVSVHFALSAEFCRWAFAGRRQPRRIFFVSRSNREACRPGLTGVVPETDWRVLYNGIDVEHLRPDAEIRERFRREHGLDGAPVIGCAVALRPRKQLEHLFAAAERLTQAKVLLAGGPVAGDEAYADLLLRNARSRLGDRLVYLGHLNELRGLYNALDVYVNTSKEEACSISIEESLACGCPVVGYASTSVDEQILPGGGEIVGQDRVDELTEALGRWLGDPQRLAEARTGARRRAVDCFAMERIADQLWEEYCGLLS